MTKEEYIYVKKKIREFTKIDLDNYGSKQMMRRLDSYISRSKALNIANYFKLLERDSSELARLRDFLTINVSEFFRDTVHFQVLQTRILPELLKHNKRLNIWSAGCSNGAEPYSIALMLEHLTPGVYHRILATDIDTSILSLAENGGPYRPAEIKNISMFFNPQFLAFKDDSFWVNENLRKKVLFRQHDLTRDSFEKAFDLIICRNVLIYFTDEAKKRLKSRFYDSLKIHGVLFVGATETMLDASEIGLQRLYPCFYTRTNEVLNKQKVMALAMK